MKQEPNVIRLVLIDGVFGSNAVFYSESDYDRLVALDEAITGAATWGDFEKALPPGEFSSLMQWAANDGEAVYRVNGDLKYTSPMYPSKEDYSPECIIDASDPFNPSEDLFGYADGNYPPWVHMIFYNLPEGFSERFAIRVTSFLSGDWDEYPYEKKDEMVAVLASEGFELL